MRIMKIYLAVIEDTQEATKIEPSLTWEKL